MKAFLLLLALLCINLSVSAPAPYSETEFQYLFTKWMNQNQKTYEMEDFFNRYSVFKDNLNFIHEHNSKNHSYTVGVNAFADLTQKEFKARNTLLPRLHERAPLKVGPHVDAPQASVDWRSRNVVAPVRDQGQCGSCYAFSSISAIETAYAIKRGSLIYLSEQQLVDCSSSYGNGGCNGGLPDFVYKYIKDQGITTQSAYPYTAVDGNCRPFTKSPVQVSSYVTLSDEKGLLTATNIGSVVVLIEADQQSFQFYSGGVFDNAACGTTVDHGVVVVGYGTDSGKNYWTVRNSWGGSWGEQGYIRMVRDKNMCAIGSGPNYPIVA